MHGNLGDAASAVTTPPVVRRQIFNRADGPGQVVPRTGHPVVRARSRGGDSDTSIAGVEDEGGSATADAGAQENIIQPTAASKKRTTKPKSKKKKRVLDSESDGEADQDEEDVGDDGSPTPTKRVKTTSEGSGPRRYLPSRRSAGNVSYALESESSHQTSPDSHENGEGASATKNINPSEDPNSIEGLLKQQGVTYTPGAHLLSRYQPVTSNPVIAPHPRSKSRPSASQIQKNFANVATETFRAHGVDIPSPPAAPTPSTPGKGKGKLKADQPVSTPTPQNPTCTNRPMQRTPGPSSASPSSSQTLRTFVHTLTATTHTDIDLSTDQQTILDGHIISTMLSLLPKLNAELPAYFAAMAKLDLDSDIGMFSEVQKREIESVVRETCQSVLLTFSPPIGRFVASPTPGRGRARGRGAVTASPALQASPAPAPAESAGQTSRAVVASGLAAPALAPINIFEAHFLPGGGHWRNKASQNAPVAVAAGLTETPDAKVEVEDVKGASGNGGNVDGGNVNSGAEETANLNGGNTNVNGTQDSDTVMQDARDMAAHNVANGNVNGNDGERSVSGTP